MTERLTAKGESPVAEPTAEQIREQKIYRTMGVTDGEYEKICSLLGRLPNYTEIGVFSVMWSEHCSYKTSKPVLKKFPTRGPRVLMGPGEGAGIVDIGDGLAVVFKIESHNHPSAVEPYQGAATGVGGIIRDIFSMGARPVALLNSLRFGRLDNGKVKYLFENVVAGIAGYGNCIGIPTVGGEVVFDESYEGNPLVNAMCVGIIEHDKIQRGVAEGIGDSVLYVGPPTGRDGIHGATFASEDLTEDSETKRPSVQVGDPFMEKLVMEACLEVISKGLVKGIQDMGAAGLTCSSSEMASKGNRGMELYLDEVPQREEGMTPYELMLSESQERMLLVVDPEREEEVKAVFRRWGVPCVKVGKVTGDGRLRLLYRGQWAADIPVKALTDECPVARRESRAPETVWNADFHDPQNVAERYPEQNNLTEALEKMLASPNIANKEWVFQQYDYMVRTSTYVPPGSDAAVIGVPGTRKALAMTVDGNGRYVWLDPYVGGKIAVCEAARNIVCSGAEPLAITDNLNFGNPEKPEVFWQLEQAVAGMAEACEILQTPVIGGNVSLYNENAKGAIYPTPVVGMVGLVHDLDHLTTQGFKEEGDIIFLLGETKGELGGSEFQKLFYGVTEGPPPALDLAVESKLLKAVLYAIQSGWVSSAHDLSEGGLAVALAECCISGQLGAHIRFETDMRPDIAMFCESQSRILLSAKPRHAEKLAEWLEREGVPYRRIGVVQGKELAVWINGNESIRADVARLERIWKDAIPCLMRS